MRYLLALLLFATPALADGEAWKSLEVPDPIPEDFNQCVRLFITDKGHENGVTVPVATFKPPLGREDRAYIEWARREGWAHIQLCGDTEET